jgi:hypothetical protein
MPKLRLTVLMGLTLVQVAVGSLVATLAVSDMAAAASPPASHTIQVGPGFSDVSPHQLVRTSANILYALAPTCDSYPNCPANSLRVYRADQPGTPASFAEQDAAHRPAAVGSVAVALDASDTIHALWNDRSGNLDYATFSTATNTWSPATILAATNWTDFGQGDEGVALALDSSGTPHAVWSAKTPDGVLHLFYANRAANWAPQQIDDVLLTGNRHAMHPALAFRPDGTLLLAWLDGTFNYVPDGAIHTRARSAAGAWGTTQTIADPDGAMTTIDNGPSLLITPDGTAHLAFVAATPPDLVRYWYDPGTGWLGDQQPPAQVTHDPSLGPDGSGGVYIYGHGTPAPTYQDHGDNLYSFHKPSGGAWGTWTLYATGSFDSSVSTRWAQFFHPFPATLDIAYWADPYPNVLSVGSDSAASTGGTASAIAANPGTTPQSAAIGTPFATPLAAAVTDALANPVAGATVVFIAPTSGASGTFTGGATTATVGTGANGVATAPAFTANGTPGAYTVTASVAGVATPASFSLTNTAAPVSALLVAAFPPTAAGMAQSFTVTAKNVGGTTVPGYTGTIHFTSSDLQAILPTDYAFVAADNGTHTFSATLKTAGPQGITATDTAASGITGTQAGITVSAAAASSLALSGFPSPTAAGAAGSVAVTARDAFGNTATAYTGTVHVTSSDNAAIVPANYTFTSGAGSGFDNGVHTFSVTLNTAGPQSITATDTVAATITGSQSNIAVTAPLLASISVAPASPTIVTGATQQFTATGHYANSTTQDLTTSATWSSSNTGVATIANASGSQGLATAKGVGPTAITAASGGVTSAPATLTVAQANTTTTLLSGKNPATDVDSITFTATVAAVSPGAGTLTGTITFKDGATTLGSPVTLTSGQATFATSTLGLGSHPITATYSGDANFASSVSASLSQQITASAAARLVVAGFASSVAAGTAQPFTITAQDASGNTAAGYVGTIHFTSNDPQATLPADYTFTGADAGVHTFTATLRTAGAQTITARDTVTPSIAGSATCSVTTGSSILLVGNNTIEGTVDENPGGTAEAFTYTAGAGGTVDTLFVYIDGANTATQVVLGLYSNGANDTVGFLLTQATITNPIKGAWNAAPVPPVSVTGGATYWIALLGPTGTGTVQFRDKPTAGTSQTSKQTDLTTLPGVWVAGATFPTSALSAYAAQSTGAISVTTAPIILGVMAKSVQSTSATLTWTTDEAATTQVEYGTSLAYGKSGAADSALVTNHSQVIGGLTANTTYHYRVHSSDAMGHASVSDDNVFTTAPLPSAPLIGDSTIERTRDSNPAGLAEAFQFTANASGAMNQLSVYIDASSTATQVLVGLYTNTARNAPGALLAQATITNPTKGAWNTASVLPVNVTGGTAYWIAVLGPTGAGTVEFRDGGAGKHSQTSARNNLGSLPALWATGTTYGSGPLSAYASQATPAPAPLPANAPAPLTGPAIIGVPNPLPPPR